MKRLGCQKSLFSYLNFGSNPNKLTIFNSKLSSPWSLKHSFVGWSLFFDLFYVFVFVRISILRNKYFRKISNFESVFERTFVLTCPSCKRYCATAWTSDVIGFQFVVSGDIQNSILKSWPRVGDRTHSFHLTEDGEATTQNIPVHRLTSHRLTTHRFNPID